MWESAHVHMESVSTPHIAHVFMPERARPSLGPHDPFTWVFTCICRNNTCNVVLLYFVFVTIFGAPLTHVSNFPQSPPSSHVSYAHPLLAYLTLYLSHGIHIGIFPYKHIGEVWVSHTAFLLSLGKNEASSFFSKEGSVAFLEPKPSPIYHHIIYACSRTRHSMHSCT